MEQDKQVFEVMKPGLFTTIQDLGRVGYQQYGMVVSGAMDPFALRIGNLLVGNKENEAGLEITLLGPVLRIINDCLIAVTGADLSPKIDGRTLPMWKSVFVRKGSELHFGKAKNGCRAYISVLGGIDVPPVMGSRSTYVKAGIGGIQGRPLQTADVLSVNSSRIRLPFDSQEVVKLQHRMLHPELIPQYSPTVEARVVPGPQLDWFQQESIDAFFTQPYTVTPQSDRMGYRLKGEKLRHKAGADIITDAVVAGVIQVPASGDPILLMADRQTTGGYPKIGTVISVDIPLVAQAKPGDHIRFRPVSLEEAHCLLFEQEYLIRQMNVANLQFPVR